MTIELVTIGKRRGSGSAPRELVADYLKRAGRYQTVVLREFASEQDLLASLAEGRGRSAPVLFATDSRGWQASSEELAGALGNCIDDGTQRISFAVGPADGWSPAMLARAKHVFAFGRITLPHELAAVILAEQIYRALTIRAGHPYHSGH